MQAQPYSRRDVELADYLASKLAPILESGVGAMAVMSCTFVVQGACSVGHRNKNWGSWVRTRMRTHGEKPAGCVWQCGRDMVASDSVEAAESVLDCFGLTMDRVYEQYGFPEHGKVYTVRLLDIIQTLAPEILTTTRLAEVA